MYCVNMNSSLNVQVIYLDVYLYAHHVINACNFNGIAHLQ